MKPMNLPRRDFLKLGTSALPFFGLSNPFVMGAEQKNKTGFQIACMTLPYGQFPLERTLRGIQSAGYKFVAWGTTHKESDGKAVPVMAADAPPQQAKDLGNRCRDLGLTPLMMFSGIYPEDKNAVEVFTSRIRQAEAAGIPQVLTFGHTKGGGRALWIERFKQLGPMARDRG